MLVEGHAAALRSWVLLLALWLLWQEGWEPAAQNLMAEMKDSVGLGGGCK